MLARAVSAGMQIESVPQAVGRRHELARALDAAFTGCEQWTVVSRRRRGSGAIPATTGPIALAQAEHALLDATPPQLALR